MGSAAKISVMVADPQRLVADAIGRSLGTFTGISVLSDHPKSGLATIDLVELFHPDVLLLEYWMEEMLAPGVIQAIHLKNPDCRIIVMSWLHGKNEVLNSLYAGAAGFLPKGVSVDQVVKAVRDVVSKNEMVFKQELDNYLDALSERDERSSELWKKLGQLNRRELQILTFLATAKPLKEIASTLDIAPKTARNYLDRMLKKTGAQSQMELLAMARQCGLIAG